jgi:hypothetical protein
MALKDYDRVGILLGLAEWTLIGRFKPGENALGMKHMLT